jgi:hypothetical protein
MADDGIIAVGPWKDENQKNSLPYRAVLRRFRDGEVVVHTQIKNRDDTTFFEHGTYFPYPLSLESLKRAVAELERRIGSS